MSNETVDTTSDHPLSAADGAVIRRDMQHFANAGQITREQANADLLRLGLEPLAPPPVAETQTADEHSAISKSPAHSPGAYRLPRLGDDPQAMAETRTLAFAMHDVQLPASVGSAVSSQIEATSREYAGMSNIERHTYMTKARSKLASMWGDAASGRIDAARRLVQEMEAKRPGIVALLERTGAGSNPLVISLLADAAARRSHRK